MQISDLDLAPRSTNVPEGRDDRLLRQTAADPSPARQEPYKQGDLGPRHWLGGVAEPPPQGGG
jgi:hypothetical protein